MAELSVYAHLSHSVGTRVATRSRAQGVSTTDPVLFVIATCRGPHALAEALAAWGERPLATGKNGQFVTIVDLYSEHLANFARQFPEQLIATNATGRAAPVGENGVRETIWAYLGDPEADESSAHLSTA
ncbi:hypothetical protein [Gordonia alkanivorans]|uniref:hypothetical protein n=1 Tax=Gordonia alkanivorans TaxID=84096 RepID=UPI0012DDE681|nr:hypothetical protein [Gordonia alkanivorans]